MILGQRRSRVVATIWGLVGVGFLAAGVVLWLDARRLSFELPAAVLALVLALAWWRQRAVLDRHGIRTVHAFREHRLLWAGIDHVEVHRPSWFRAALVVVPKGGRPAISVPASAGLQRRQRNRLVELLTDLSRQHGFAVLMPGVTPDDAAVVSALEARSAAEARSAVEARSADGTPAPAGRNADDPAPADTDARPADQGPDHAHDDDTDGEQPRAGQPDDRDEWLALLEPVAAPVDRTEQSGAVDATYSVPTEEPVTAHCSGADDPERDDPAPF